MNQRAVAAIRRGSSEMLFAMFVLFVAATSIVVVYVDIAHGSGSSITMLNVSYDPTRELYKAYNDAFAQYWKQKSGDDLFIQQSHAGSGAQARAVIDGLPADVVTLALGYDIDVIAEQAKLLPDNWQSRLPHNSSPYTSTIVFLVRKGNPKTIKDWNDLIRDDIEVITPNPKTSGGARWNYLAAWAYALKRQLGDIGKLKTAGNAPESAAAQQKARDFVTKLYKHVPVLDTGARGSTTTFVQREIGDVLITWENEAFLSVKELGSDKVEIVVPSLSIRAEPPVAVIDKNAEAHGTAELAKAYLDYLYSPDAQRIIAKNFYRPVSPELADKEDRARFPAVPMVTIEDFGGWKQAQQTHFNDGGVFDQIYVPAAN